MLLSRTSIQTVELSRDFMLPPNFSCGADRSKAERPRNSNTGSRKYLEQFPQVDHQSQAVVMPKHSDAVRHIFGSLLQEIVGIDGIGADDFVGCDTDAQIVMLGVAGKRSDHHMLR